MGGLAPGFQFGTLVQIGGLTLNQVDPNGVYWHTASPIDGWDSPDVRYTSTDRQSDHGAWASPVYASARPVTLTGTVEASSPAALEVAREQLIAAASWTDTLLTVFEDQPKQAVVRRSGKTLWQPKSDRVATYSLLVTAQDPRRYSTTLNVVSTGLRSVTGGLAFPVTFPITFSATSVSGQIAAPNVGSMETRPVLTVTGPCIAPQIISLYQDGTVKTLIYNGPGGLAAGEQLVVDTDSHTVTSGGASRRRWISGDWPNIPAGQTVQFQFRDPGNTNTSTLLTASWRSAWM